MQHAAIPQRIPPDTHAAYLWAYIGQLVGDVGAQVLQRRRTQVGYFVQEVVVELLTHYRQALAQKAQVQHHAVGGIARAGHADFCVVGVAVDAAAAGGFDLALQGVGRVKEKALADGVPHG